MTDPILERLGSALADRYRVDRQVGAGGMATVFVTRDLKHDRDVALKVLHPELAAVIGAERFLQEIRTTARLQHPHILGLIDSGSADGLLYYVMPFVRGESLRERLTREKLLPVNEALRISSEVASALDYAHREGVVHRDVKPENVLLHDGRALGAEMIWEAFRTARSALERLSEEHDESLRSFATTLTCLVATPERLIVGQLGDGAVAAAGENDRLKIVTTLQRGEYANEDKFFNPGSGSGSDCYPGN